ncbi:hypothetical protein RJ639_033731 [Escallonia herrerae]|uniref:Ubiquinol oxidase n=1 Tax=Escallonia herrerae TaxID=1293975 RepID=A0AA88WVI3_9ASTE|nr:hypothetical protein RJ639_033731 [Escallonia herrerae]
MSSSPSSQAVAAATTILRRFDEAAVVRDQGLGFGYGGGARWGRMMSTAVEAAAETPGQKASGAVDEKKEKEKKEGGELMVSSYWGISRPKITREDGTAWPWNCFMPWQTYRADLLIDLSKHHVPKTFLDKVAYRTVKLLRIPTDIFFQSAFHSSKKKHNTDTIFDATEWYHLYRKTQSDLHPQINLLSDGRIAAKLLQRRYGCRAMMLETVAAVPGMVGGMLLHLRSLRKFEHSGGWVKALLEEAENERMHLMTMVELVKPKWYERLLVLTVQGVFFNAFFVLYVLSPKLAHRIVGYLEEEAIHSYTEYLKDIDSGAIENVPAPAIAIDYWRLPKDATLKDVITVIRADEAHHRDVNHFASVSVIAYFSCL